MVSNALDIVYNHGCVFSSSDNVLEYVCTHDLHKQIPMTRWHCEATKLQSLLLLIYSFCGDLSTSVLVKRSNIGQNVAKILQYKFREEIQIEIIY